MKKYRLYIISFLLVVAFSTISFGIYSMVTNSDEEDLVQTTGNADQIVESLTCGESGLSVGQCSKIGPTYCDEQGNIVDNCQLCGCPRMGVACLQEPCPSYVCQSDGSCELEAVDFDDLEETDDTENEIDNNSDTRLVTCGKADAYGNDNKITLPDLSAILLIYGGTCSEERPPATPEKDFASSTYGVCGAQDSNEDGVIGLVDLASILKLYKNVSCV